MMKYSTNEEMGPYYWWEKLFWSPWAKRSSRLKIKSWKVSNISLANDSRKTCQVEKCLNLPFWKAAQAKITAETWARVSVSPLSLKPFAQLDYLHSGDSLSESWLKADLDKTSALKLTAEQWPDSQSQLSDCLALEDCHLDLTFWQRKN